MSTGIDKRTIVVTKKCPDCGFSNMRIFEDGTFHCGKCLSGGMICCKSHRYLLKDNEIKTRVKNDYVFKTFICDKCQAVITEKPCEWCIKKDLIPHSLKEKEK